ncbi:MAG: cysteine desulfurase family protein [Actinomycetota bacterium]|jgi:cysteine desulfurase|nr:cysteine desulfurase family protein [Actinomycetota bacterium]
MTSEAPSRVIYLDHNATTPVAPEVADAMEPYLRAEFGNPSSDHALGRRARQAVEEARAHVAALVGAAFEEIVFTSGGTESNNLAIRGVATRAPAKRRRIVTSTVEHPATTAPLALLEASGWTITRLAVTDSGTLDVGAADADLGEDVALVSMMLAQNETGALFSVAEVAAAAREHGALVHSDAAQAVGKVPVSVEDLGVDLLSIAGHKCYGPKGIGALYVRRDTPLSPLVLGAGQEHGVRPGTENVPGIVGLGAAARLAHHRLSTDAPRIAGLRDELWEALSATVPGILRYTPEGACLPNTLLVSFPGVLGADVLAQAPQIAASTGSACHAGEHMPNATLLAMGIEPQEALGAVRLTLGRDSTAAEVVTAGELLARAHAVLPSANR